MSETQAIIVHDLDAMPVGQRTSDGYINATAMCQAAGKLWGNYHQTQETERFLQALASDIGIPISLLVHSVRGGKKNAQGTWVHPLVAVNLAQWCSASFAVQVAKWVIEWATTGTNPLSHLPMTSLFHNEVLQKAMSQVYHAYLSRTNGNFAHVNADLCREHSDLQWWPSQYKAYAKRLGLPAKQRTSGLQVLRTLEPPSAGAISVEKWAVMSGAVHDKARAIAHKSKELFALCLEAGIQSAEMLAAPDDEL
jgi:hypothetical protein